MPDISKKIDGKKFMWDGSEYENEEDAKKAENTYKNNNFETEVISDDRKFLVYTRRVVSEVVVEGDASI